MFFIYINMPIYGVLFGEYKFVVGRSSSIKSDVLGPFITFPAQFTVFLCQVYHLVLHSLSLHLIKC